MLVVKICLFIGIVFFIKLTFIYSLEIYEKKIEIMKDIETFVGDLRVYSCTMEMSINEILENYSFKSQKIRKLCEAFEVELHNEEDSNNKYDILKSYMKLNINTPERFNDIFCSIIKYYGSSYSEVLEKKLSYSEKLLYLFISEYEKSFNEKKVVLNRLSLLIGCLAAIILV